VTLTGAEKITVGRQHQIIKSDEFMQKALDFLKNNPPETSICQYDPVRMPEDLVLAGSGKDLKLSPCLVRSGARNQAKVRIAVLSDDGEIAAREVTFRFKYSCRKIVSCVDIPQGGVVGFENTKVEETVSDTPASAGETVFYGCVAKRRIPANTVIIANMTSPARPQVLLERNQNVLIKINRLGLWVTAIGKTMQQGRVGEYIKVQNLDSQRIIMAKISEDGSVEPIF
jgi:flagella basal body P-ring formation protein FlgA